MSSIKEIKNNDNESSYYDVSADNNVGIDIDTDNKNENNNDSDQRRIQGGGLSPPMDQ